MKNVEDNQNGTLEYRNICSVMEWGSTAISEELFVVNQFLSLSSLMKITIKNRYIVYKTKIQLISAVSISLNVE